MSSAFDGNISCSSGKIQVNLEMESQKICPPFCPESCTENHHDLLRTLIKVNGCKARTLKEFQKTVKFWDNINPEDPIPDPNKDYRYPLLHWAAILGKPSAVECLISIGHPNTLKSSLKGENAMHRVVRCFYKTLTLTRHQSKKVTKVLVKLIDLLADALFCTDDNGNTPLHSCAIYITELKLRNEISFFEHMFQLMIQKVIEIEQGKISSLINQQNKEGNTLLHILVGSKTKQCLGLVRFLVTHGANFEVRNLEGWSSRDIGIRTSYQMVEIFYDLKQERNSENDNGHKSPDSSVQLGENHSSYSAYDSDEQCCPIRPVNTASASSSINGSKKRKLMAKPMIMPTVVHVDEDEVYTVPTSLNNPLPSSVQPEIRKEKSYACSSRSEDDPATDNDDQSGRQHNLTILLKKVGKEKLVEENAKASKVELKQRLKKSAETCLNLMTSKDSLQDKCTKIFEQISIKRQELNQLKKSLSESCNAVSEMEEKLKMETKMQTELKSEIKVYDDILKCMSCD